jgi:ketosteroid isomerase-like protein
MLRQNLFGIVAGTLIGLFLSIGSANAQPSADMDAVKAANTAFYVALSSRDTKQMEPLWANKPYVVNIGPRAKSAAIGYEDAVTRWGGASLSAAFLELNATMTSIAQIQTDGKLAWVIGTERASGTNKAGEPFAFETFVTNTFEKEGDRWLMVSHHAQVITK